MLGLTVFPLSADLTWTDSTCWMSLQEKVLSFGSPSGIHILLNLNQVLSPKFWMLMLTIQSSVLICDNPYAILLYLYGAEEQARGTCMGVPLGHGAPGLAHWNVQQWPVTYWVIAWTFILEDSEWLDFHFSAICFSSWIPIRFRSRLQPFICSELTVTDYHVVNFCQDER